MLREYHEMFAATVAGGSTKKYGLVVNGKTVTVDKIEEMSDSEVEQYPVTLPA